MVDKSRRRVRIGLTLAPDVADILEKYATEERPRYKIIEEAVRTWGSAEIGERIPRRESPRSVHATGAAEFPNPEAESAAKHVRAEKKAGRAKRKAELQEDTKKFLGEVADKLGSDVSTALAGADVSKSPAIAAFENMGVQVVDVTPTYCPFHRPKWCAPDCKHRVKA
jgi:hypothetical protein